MAKTKSKKSAVQQTLSPKKYIISRARTLPVTECWINESWKEEGEASVFIFRRHSNGNFTYGAFLIDTFCKGVYQTFYETNITPERKKDVLKTFEDLQLSQTDYATVHNLIYGAVEFAQEAGIEPHKDFAVSEYILDEDTEDIPLMEFEFGKEGKHFLVASDTAEANRYLYLMEKNLDSDSYEYVIADDFDESEEQPEEYDPEKSTDNSVTK